MNEYRDIPLIKLVDLAETSSSELGATGGNYVVDYATGKPFEAPDYDTALFLASAREIVLELARRLREIESPYSGLSVLQWKLLRFAKSEYGTTLRTNEETSMRQADDLVEQGLLKKEYDPRMADGRVYSFYITSKGRAALEYCPDGIVA